jgi:hypothetical protein
MRDLVPESECGCFFGRRTAAGTAEMNSNLAAVIDAVHAPG